MNEVFKRMRRVAAKTHASCWFVWVKDVAYLLQIVDQQEQRIKELEHRLRGLEK